jgi:hypothetical protein
MDIPPSTELHICINKAINLQPVQRTITCVRVEFPRSDTGLIYATDRLIPPHPEAGHQQLLESAAQTTAFE